MLAARWPPIGAPRARRSRRRVREIAGIRSAPDQKHAAEPTSAVAIIAARVIVGIASWERRPTPPPPTRGTYPARCRWHAPGEDAAMQIEGLRSTVTIAKHPLHPM